MSSAKATFSQYERLREPSQFKRVFNEGELIKGGIFDFYILANGLENSRLGISAPKRRQKLATARNRMKRLIREAFRRRKTEIRTAVDIVALLKRGVDVKAKTFEAVDKDIVQALQRRRRNG